MSPEPLRAVTCQQCGYLSLRRTDDVMEAGRVALDHLIAAGHAEPNLLIHPLDAAERLEAA